MKEFEFLRNSPHFEREYHTIPYGFYYFTKKEKGLTKYGAIKIPRETSKEKVDWAYYEQIKTENQFQNRLDEGNDEERKCLKNLGEIWFAELLDETSASLEQRDKLRRLFI